MLAAVLTGCVVDQRPWLHPYRPTTAVAGVTYCAKHHIPTISVRGYHSINASERLVLVHDWSSAALKCDPDNPNRLADDRKFQPSKIHAMGGTITYCPLCDADYWHCHGGGRQLGETDIQQITSIVMHHSEFHKPILRIFAVYSPNAVVIGGRQERVGDVFSDIGLAKLGDRWVIAYPVSSHRVVATGRDDL